MDGILFDMGHGEHFQYKPYFYKNLFWLALGMGFVTSSQVL